jgi:HEAT repeats
MYRWISCGLLVASGLASLPAVVTARQVPDTHADDDEQLFRSTLPVDGKTVLAFFDPLILSEADVQRALENIKKLDSQSFKERDQATNQLIAEGIRVLPLLEQGMHGATLERVKRMERCIKALERPDWNDIIAASARLLVKYRPAGAGATVLAYLPFAPEDASGDVLAALAGLAIEDGKLSPAVLAALGSRQVRQRAAAAIIVGMHGDAQQRKGVFRLLDDPDWSVRLRAAQGLVAARQKVALPILVDLLKHAPSDAADIAAGMLIDIAGTSAPSVEWKDDKEHRAKYHAAWLAWWNTHKDKLDLDKIDVKDLINLVGEQRLAKDTGMRFWKALADGDVNMIRKTAAVPFFLGRSELLNTAEQLERELTKNDVRKEIEQLFQVLKFSRVIKHKEFSKIAQDDSAEFLAKLSGGKFYAVCLNGTIDNRMMGEIAWIVRVRGGTARVIGVAVSQSFK